MTAEEVQAQVRQWLETVVIGLNLCPFAAPVVKQDAMAIAVCPATDPEEIYHFSLQQLDHLQNAPADTLATTLVAVPEGLDDFEEYLDVLDYLEGALAEAGIEDSFQIASFHPDYCFDGLAGDDPANYTNRSPVPLFHLLRQADITQALASVKNPEQIPERNIALMRRLGLEQAQALAAGQAPPPSERAILSSSSDDSTTL